MSSVSTWFRPDAILNSIGNEQQRRMNKAAHTLAAYVKQSFQKTGKLGSQKRDAAGRFKARYHRLVSGGQKRTLYGASKKDETPAIQTGDLKRSIIAEVVKDGGEFVGMVGPMATVKGKSLKYAYWLEFGTSRMKARPFLRPAVTENRSKLYDILANG